MAQVHHQHLVRNVAHHRQVVRDEQVRQAEFCLQVGQQVEHLRLHRHVERRHRLVGHHQPGAEHQRTRNGDALALAAREHVRVAVGKLGPQAHLRQHGAGAFGALGLGQAGVDGQRVFQCGADLLARVERPIGVLEHQLHGLAQLLALAGSGVRDLGAVQPQLPAGGRLDQGHHARQGRFAAARFTDHCQRLAGAHAERHAAHRLQVRWRAEHAAADGVDLAQVGGLHHGRRLGACLRGDSGAAVGCLLRLHERAGQRRAHAATCTAAASGPSAAMRACRSLCPSG